MFSAASRQVVRNVARQQSRAFSATASVGAAAEVKKLGVIGAGQMVNHLKRKDLQHEIDVSRVLVLLLSPHREPLCQSSSLTTHKPPSTKA